MSSFQPHQYRSSSLLASGQTVRTGDVSVSSARIPTPAVRQSSTYSHSPSAVSGGVNSTGTGSAHSGSPFMMMYSPHEHPGHHTGHLQPQTYNRASLNTPTRSVANANLEQHVGINMAMPMTMELQHLSPRWDEGESSQGENTNTPMPIRHRFTQDNTPAQQAPVHDADVGNGNSNSSSNSSSMTSATQRYDLDLNNPSLLNMSLEDITSLQHMLSREMMGIDMNIRDMRQRMGLVDGANTSFQQKRRPSIGARAA